MPCLRRWCVLRDMACLCSGVYCSFLDLRDGWDSLRGILKLSHLPNRRGRGKKERKAGGRGGQFNRFLVFPDGSFIRQKELAFRGICISHSSFWYPWPGLREAASRRELDLKFGSKGATLEGIAPFFVGDDGWMSCPKRRFSRDLHWSASRQFLVVEPALRVSGGLKGHHTEILIVTALAEKAVRIPGDHCILFTAG